MRQKKKKTAKSEIEIHSRAFSTARYSFSKTGENSLKWQKLRENHYHAASSLVQLKDNNNF